jgi:hypothetical protein
MDRPIHELPWSGRVEHKRIITGRSDSMPCSINSKARPFPDAKELDEATQLGTGPWQSTAARVAQGSIECAAQSGGGTRLTDGLGQTVSGENRRACLDRANPVF